MKNILKKIEEHLSIRRNVKRIIFFGIFGGTFLYLFWGIPLPTRLASQNLPVSTKIFDRNEKLIYEIYTDKKRSPIKLSELPKFIPEATISIEDKDFYKHQGFSVTGITRAIYNNVFKRDLQGGSTISQQLVKNALLTQERTIRRKAQEVVLTIIVEGIYTKDQILEMYLNEIPYGGTAYGIETASETYFGKQAKDLNLAEAALLVGLPQRPSTYSPFGAHPELAKLRQEEVLKQMVANKYISTDDATNAGKETLKYTSIKPPAAPHFALWIKEQLTDKYGVQKVEQGGLRVYTTLDLDIQDIAQQAVATEVGKLKKQNVHNGAVIVTQPSTGEILAMVGSKDYFASDEDGKVNVILAQRQPGSSIKPLNYALAIRDKKITLATALSDVPSCFQVPGQPLYCPVNYDGMFHGLVQTRFALGNSFNIPAVKILAINGVDNFVGFANQIGISTFIDPKNYGLSLTLGGGEVRPYDMAEAFGVFANQGIREPLIAITKVTDWKGITLEQTDVKKQELTGTRVLDPTVTFLISHILLDNGARSAAFGTNSQLNVKGHSEVSVKTGTTNDRRDNWTIGYTGDAVVVTWVGNNDNSQMSGAVSGISGASPIWNKVMKAVLDKAEAGAYELDGKSIPAGNRGHAWPKQPEGVTGANICTNNTGQQAPANADPSQIHAENRQIYTDPTGAVYCLDCPIASSSATIRYPLQ
ncbi:MAG: Penicillin-binding protein [Candidatus Woesebacteria bacterium GW2011_GWA2_40_7]|uniref:Penicillin-binding protein n=1 Tax=Candidatus Woesebacteria bacterium GW2011_GWA2_40_7 TaxID=1618562 RepID=A0A0G0VPY8_9BACT|nr:MAG: Penicillin-binding protein [Candidatus Woesebacteria bacterium GW2011_GWA2_40_7]